MHRGGLNPCLCQDQGRPSLKEGLSTASSEIIGKILFPLLNSIILGNLCSL